MPHVTTVEVDGTPVPINAVTPWPSRLSLRLRGVSTLTLNLLGAKPDETDPYLGKPIVLKIDGDVVFAGDVVDAPLNFTAQGWGKVYQCRDLRARADKFPFTDDNTLGDYATFNYDPEDPDKIDSRLGRSAGQILQDVLTMQQNAEALDSYGIGGYTSLSPPTLPAETIADLTAMTVVPPRSAQVGGGRFFSSLTAFTAAWAPNFVPVIRPDGVIRIIDVRTPNEHVLTLGDCDQRVFPSGLTRSTSDRFQRVVVRGRAIAVPKLLTLSNGGLLEKFAWADYPSNALAKAAWTLEQYRQDQLARSEGSCSVTDLTHVVLDSNPATQTWGANEWDQAHRRGRLYVFKTSGSGLTWFDSARIVANTAKGSGGTSTVTLETPLVGTDFDGYHIYGISTGASLVWRLYEAADPTIRAALARRMTYPVPFVNAGGTAAELVSYPQATVCTDPPFGAGPPFQEFFDPIVNIDVDHGTFLLGSPTWEYSNGPPRDVRILAAVNTGVLQAIRPASGYEGDSHAVEGLEDTMTITMDSWRDPVNQAAMEAYAQDVLDSVKDAVVEGSVRVDDMVLPALAFGCGISIDAVGYATGWEGLNAPVTDADLTWNTDGAASHYTTTIQVSTRRAGPALAAYLQPQRRPAAAPPAGPAFAPFAPFARGDVPGAASGGYEGQSSGAGGEMDWASAAASLAAPDAGYSGEYDPGRKYKTPGRYSTARPYRTTRTPYSRPRKYSSTSEKELAADRAKAREGRRSESDARRDLGASRPDRAARCRPGPRRSGRRPIRPNSRASGTKGSRRRPSTARIWSRPGPPGPQAPPTGPPTARRRAGRGPRRRGPSARPVRRPSVRPSPSGTPRSGPGSRTSEWTWKTSAADRSDAGATRPDDLEVRRGIEGAGA